jgi:hypothetical protein
MKTKRNMKNKSNIKSQNKKKYTKKNKIFGGTQNQDCGINDNGDKLPDCPVGYRCKKHKKSNKGTCIVSILILNYNDKEIELNAPYQRHSKWDMELIRNKIDDFMIIYNDSKYTRGKLSSMIQGLIEQLQNNSIVSKTTGDATRDEKIIRYIMLKEELNKINRENIPDEVNESLDENKNIEDKSVFNDETPRQEEKVIQESNSSNANIFSLFTSNETSNKVKEIKPLTQDEIKKIDDLQDKLGLYPGDIDDKAKNKFIKKAEKEHHDFLIDNNKIYDEFLYPELDDPNFNTKIAKRKEFFDTQYDGKIYDVKTQAEKMCNAEFELMPHQLFVKNFLSMQTPYNSLLLYHGLGTGKTCSAIGVAEEMRQYYKNIGSSEKIIIVASPNVQANFKNQLFDERKLKQEGSIWITNTCVGNNLLKEINANQMKDSPKAKIVSQINTLIQKAYLFVGYVEFASYIQRKTMVDESLELDENERKEKEIENVKKYFNNRLIIVDEVHNISAVQSNKKNKKTSTALIKLCKYADNLRLLLLSATPMYNSHKEIVWITNLLNSVDKKSLIKEEEIFDKNGDFIESKQNKDGTTIEGGKELLQRKLTGYISYIRGENPYTFPFRIYPTLFDNSKSLESLQYPKNQMNNKPIDKSIEFVPLYINNIGEYQNKVYNKIMENTQDKLDINNNNQVFEELDSFGYTLLSAPIQSLNITYPSEDMTIDNLIGSSGLKNVMNQKIKNSPFLLRYGFEYKPEILEKYGPIFSLDKISNYSEKIYNICQLIKKSKGIIMIYSQYIDSGVVPIALTLEEMGFTRFGVASHTKSLFNNPPSEPLDSLTMQKKSQYKGTSFKTAKYAMITGDKYFSPNNSLDLKEITSSANIHGEKIKVVLITKAAAEGLDFKNIRQLHVMEPWYNLSRIEQIIGRTVRNLSHCALPFEERNVEIYLHGTKLDNDKEAVDLYTYRYAEKKAIQIGKVTRIMKETAVDCLLNIGQTNLSLEKLNQNSQGQTIELKLSSKNDETISYEIGDRPYTALCDYMDNCNYICKPNENIKKDSIVNSNYNEDFAKINYPIIIKRIRALFKEKGFYKRDELLQSILQHKEYPVEHIDFALTKLVNDKSDYITNKYGSNGYLINKDNYYVFQPVEITDERASLYDRENPVDLKYYSLDMELPLKKETIKTNIEKKQENNELSDAVDILFIKLNDNIEQINTERKARSVMEDEIGELDKINKRKLAIIRKKYQTDISNSESDWYKNAGLIYNILNQKYQISEELLEKYFVYHYLDCLNLDDQLLIINKIYKKDLNGSDIPFFQHIINYYDNHILIGKKKGIVLPSNENKIYIFNEDKQDWILAKPTEFSLFTNEIIKKFPIKREKLNNIIGFIYQSKKERVFKIKNFKEAKNNTGVSCSSLGKVDIMHRIEPILKENPHNITNWPKYDPEEFDNILKPGLCVFLECIMRFYNESSREKYWFLDSIEALANNISKL